MNVHDSEKVAGTLMARGYTQVETPEDAELVLYNTCSIRDKAEQKVFNRLQQFKRAAGKGVVHAQHPAALRGVAEKTGQRLAIQTRNADPSHQAADRQQAEGEQNP